MKFLRLLTALLFTVPVFSYAAETIPTGTTQGNSDGSFRITWSVIGNYYDVNEYKNGVSQGRTRRYTNFIDLSGKGNGTWTYKVTTFKRVSNGHFNETFRLNAGTATVNVSIPSPSRPSSISSPSVDGDGSYTVSWGTSSGIGFSYRLEERTNSGSWSTIYTGGARSLALSSRVAAEYDYRVRACNDVCSSYSPTTHTSVIKAPGAASAPVLSGTHSLSSYVVSWPVVAGVVDRYELSEQLNGGGWATVFSGAATTTSLSNRQDGIYGYRVRACNAAGCGGYSSSASTIVAVAPGSSATLTVFPTHSTSGDQSVSWSAASGVIDYYHLEQKKDGGSWQTVSQSNVLTYSFSGLNDGSYQYSVKACNSTSTFTACGPAKLSGAVTVLLTPQVPTSVSLPSASVDGSYNLTWQNGGGLPDRYMVEERTSGAWSEVQNASSLSFTASGKTDGSYEYRIKACNSSGCSEFAPVVSVAVLNIPLSPTAISGPATTTVDSYELSWNVGQGQITHYRLEEKYNTGDWLLAQESLETSASFSSKVAGVYQYRVSACNQSGCGSPTSVHEITVDLSGVLPTPLAPTLALPSATSSDLSANDAIGSLAGNFRVDESGNATYSIPISVPEGIAGVTPQMSLQYSSSAGNGLLGQGWSLQGGSSISRCRSTLSQDENPKPLSWTVQDRLCLDGQRLLPRAGYTYGAVGAIYTTEVDSFIKVTSIGGTAGAPQSFSVERKDGSLSIYGGTSDSRQAAVSGTLRWAQNSFADSVGNTITYRYEGGVQNHRLKSVEYAIDSNGVAHSEVEFSYETRSDSITGYIAGYPFSTTERLKSLSVFNNATEVRSYQLGYANSPASGNLSRLISVQECAERICLPATNFDWGQSSFSIASSGNSISLGGSHDRDLGAFNFKPADINGDGFTDVVWYYHLADGMNDLDYVLRYALSDGSKLVPATFSNGSTGIRYNDDSGLTYELIDYNSDGRMDVALKNAGNWQIHLSEVDSSGNWKLRSTTITTPVTDKNATFADVNSDGLVDVIYKSSDRAWVSYLERISGSSDSSNTVYQFGSTAMIPDLYFGNSGTSIELSAASDINGDGLVDINIHSASLSCEAEIHSYCESSIRDAVYSVSSEGSLIEYFGSRDDITANFTEQDNFASDRAGGKVRYIDINGDGLVERLDRKFSLVSSSYSPAVSEELYLRINTGSGYTDQQLVGVIPKDDYRFFDYNFDGYNDIYWHDTTAKQIKVATWNSVTSSFNSPVNLRSTSGSTTAAHIIADINSDSIPDYFVFKDDRLWSYLGQAGGGSQNRITRITNGLGTVTNVTYDTLGSGGHYARLSFGNGSGDPMFCYDGSCDSYYYATDNTAGFYTALNRDWSGTDTLGKTGPVMELIGPMPVVTRVSSSAPIASNPSAQSSISYYYGGAKIQASGRGFLGFERLKTVDDQTGVQTITTYRQDWPFIGYPLRTQTYSAQGKLLSESENTWRLKGFDSSWPAIAKNQGTAALGSVQPYIARSVEKAYALASNGTVQGAVLHSQETDNVYDNYGNPTRITVSTLDASDSLVSRKITDNVYGSTEWDQRMARLSRTTVTTERGSDSDIRTSAFSYYDSGVHKGLLKEEIIEPNDVEQRLATLYEYDAVGNKVRATQTANGEVARVTASIYDADGRYLLETRNGFDQVTQTIVSRNSLGQVTEARNIDGVRATSDYTPMGRQYFSADETGNWSQTLLNACDAHCPTIGVYLSETLTAGGGSQKTYYDKLGREVRMAKRQFDGSWTFVDTEYDNLGRVSRKSEPHSGVSQYWTRLEYDILGRVTKTYLPGISQPVQVSYQGLTSVTTNPKGQIKTETKNVLGELTEVIDNEQGRITYGYDAQGNLLTVTTHGSLSDPHNVVVSMSYDRLGRKLAMNDPDKGVWSYRYNAFGELVEQTDAKGQITTMSYDRMGRMVTRLDKRSDGSVEGDTRWTYNNGTFGNGLGALSQIEDVVSGYLKIVNYDSFGRSSETGVSFSANDDHYEKVVYDQFGRLFQSFDAAGDGEWNSHAIQQHYNAYGYLEKVSDAVHINGEPRTTYYRVISTDVRGQVTEFVNGNNVTTTKQYDAATGRLASINSSVLGLFGGVQELSYSWDDLGNLIHRHDYSGDKSLEETFAYDGLNRLASSQVSGRSAQTLTYNSIGNITHKSDVGDYTYGGSQAGPHAVTSTSDGISYSYDANGNLSSDSLSNDGQFGGRTLRYTTFDKPFEIKKGNHTTTFKYGPDRGRYLRTDTSASGTTVTRYIGAVEKITKANGTQEVKRYLGNALVTISLDSNQVVTGESTKYLHKDHLGSTDVITDALGNVLQALSFDAWGQRRNAVDWEALGVVSLLNFDTSNSTRGFTGHEMLDDVGLIHMNGRVYDARLGRFLQADPFIQAATDTQMYNRYSYVRNNPLNATDPSGYFLSHILTRKYIQSSWIGKNVIQPVLQAVSRNPVLNAIATIVIAYYGGPAAVAAYSEAVVYANGGSLSDGLKAGAMSYAQSYVFGQIGASDLGDPGRIFAHAVAGGVFSVLQGGKFGHGFVSAGVTKSFSTYAGFDYSNRAPEAVIGRTIAASIVGGTTSRVSGGKFTNGAITAAFGHMFNAESGIKKAAKATQNTRRQRLISGAQDGHLTLEEANYWWAHGNGQDLTVDLNRIDLSNVSTSDFSKVGASRGFQLLFNSDDGFVYGNLRLELGPNNTVTAPQGYYDTYNFELHYPLHQSVIRNIGTVGGFLHATSQTGNVGRNYNIYFRGSAVVSP